VIDVSLRSLLMSSKGLLAGRVPRTPCMRPLYTMYSRALAFMVELRRDLGNELVVGVGEST
jgi:hypothetical protein